MNDEEVEERSTGTVLEFDARRGFGFILPEGEDDQTKKIFCHWKQIQTEDRWPQLSEKLVVEYTLKKDDKGKLQAEDVTMIGGDKISIGDVDNKNYNMDQKYKGKVNFYDRLKGFGFIIPEETIEWSGETVDKEKGIYVPREEIITEDEPPALNNGMKVEFYVYKSDKGLAAGHVSAVGGGKIVFKNTGQKRRRDFGGWGGRGRGRGRGGYGGFKRPRFGPAPFPMARFDPNEIEVGLYVFANNIGGLIGKGGETVQKMRKDSGGAKIQFADSQQRGFSDRQVVSLTGDAEQVSKACYEMVKKLEELNEQSGRPSTLVFLVPHQYCGMFIGKKGSNLKEIKEECNARVIVANNPVQLFGGALVSLAEVRGSVDEIGEACKKVVPLLGNIAKKVIQEQMGFGGFGGFRGW